MGPGVVLPARGTAAERWPRGAAYAITPVRQGMNTYPFKGLCSSAAHAHPASASGSGRARPLQSGRGVTGLGLQPLPPAAAVGERRQFRRDGVGVGLIALESSPQTPPGRLNAGDAVLAYQRPSASLAAAHDRRTQGGSSSRHSTVGVGSTYRHPIDRSLWRCRARSLPNPASARTQTYPKLRSVPSLGQLERRCDVHAGSQGQPPCTPRQVAFAVRDGRSMIKGSPKT